VEKWKRERIRRMDKIKQNLMKIISKGKRKSTKIVLNTTADLDQYDFEKASTFLFQKVVKKVSLTREYFY
jgi:hypothetical protein